MRIYLDIDETILINEYLPSENGYKLSHRPTNHLKPFLEHMVKNYDVYWLTTHCQGDATNPVRYLSKHVGEDIVPLLMKIKPTTWREFKTTGINLTEDFLWFDDTLMPEEEDVLRKAGKLGSFIKVDLDENPDILLDFVEKPPICRGYIVDIFKRSYMLHVWTWPKFGLGWHRKLDGPNKKIFGIQKY